MSDIITVGLDPAKNVFQVQGADGTRRAVLRKKLRRAKVLDFLTNFRDASLQWKPAVALIFGAAR